MYRKILFALMLFSIALSVSAEGKDFKIAVVNMEKIFQSYYETKIVDANLKKQAEVYKAYAENLNKSRLKLLEKYKELRDAAQNIALSEAQRESKRLASQEQYRLLMAKEAELTQYNREKQRQLRDEYEKKRAVLLRKIKNAVIRRSVLEGYSLVMDMSGKTLNNIPAVIYHKSSIDITDNVIKDLNQGHEIKKTEAKTK